MSGLNIPLPGEPSDYASVPEPKQAVSVESGGDELNGYDTTGITISQLNTVFTPSEAKTGDSVELWLSTNLPQNRQFAVYVSDGTTDVEIGTISPNPGAGSAQVSVDFKVLFINDSANGQFRGVFTGVSSTPAISHGAGYANGLDLTQPITVSVRTNGVWNGGDGFSYIDGYQSKIFSQ